MPTLINFATVGRRRKPDSGIYFPSDCGQYALYLSDQVYGMPVREPIWLAIVYEPGLPCGRVIGRKRSRGGAVKVCRRHCREARTRPIKPQAVTRSVTRRAARGEERRPERVERSPKRVSQGQLF